VNQCQQSIAAIKDRQHAAMIQRIEREQSAQTAEFKRRMVAPLPARWARKALAEHNRRCKSAGETDANRWLLDIGQRAESCHIQPEASDSDICDLAKRKAGEAASLLETFKGSNARPTLERHCRRAGITPPSIKIDDGQAIARMTDHLWWRPRLRRLHGSESEALARSLGFVHETAGRYVSDEAVSRRKQQKRRNRETLEATELVSEDGEILSLAEIYDSSLANKSLRRAELMTRAKGYEQIALECGHVGLFLTITCPGRMHARLFKSGQPNPDHDSSTANDGHAYLQRNWERMRAAMERSDIKPYGLRIAEPHHDGTPHWHMLAFVAPEQAEELTSIMQHYAMQESPDEPGAAKHRFKVERIRQEKGSAVGYLVKYVCKNLDGEGMGDELDGMPPNESALRVETWASVHRIRQFQAFGEPPVSIWRELRRIPAEQMKTAPAAMQAAHLAVQKTDDRQADYGAYIKACGGVGLKRKDCLLTVAKEEKRIQGRYGLATAARPVGVALNHSHGRVFRSDRRTWQPLRSAKTALAAPPWTCVNNCTHSTNQRVTTNPPWWKPETELESTAKDADGFLLGVFAEKQWETAGFSPGQSAREAEKRKGSNPSAPAGIPPYHNRMIGAFRHGYQTA